MKKHTKRKIRLIRITYHSTDFSVTDMQILTGMSAGYLNKILKGESRPDAGGPIGVKSDFENRRFTRAEVAEMRNLARLGKSLTKISDKLGENLQTVSDAVRGRGVYEKIENPPPVKSDYGKLSESEVKTLREKYHEGGKEPEDIAKEYEISKSHVLSIARGDRRPDCDGPTYGRVRSGRGAKMEPESVQEIRKRAFGGEPQKSIAEDFDVSDQTVSNAVRGKTYQDCPGPIKGEDY